MMNLFKVWEKKIVEEEVELNVDIGAASEAFVGFETVLKRKERQL